MRVLPDRTKEPQIWLGNVGQIGDESEFSVFEPTLNEFVTKAVKELRLSKKSDRIYPWPRMRVALPFVGTGHGGVAAKKGQLAEGLATTLKPCSKPRSGHRAKPGSAWPAPGREAVRPSLASSRRSAPLQDAYRA